MAGMDPEALLVPLGIDDSSLFALALCEDDEERYWLLVVELHRRGSAVIFELASTALNSADPMERATGAHILGQLGFDTGHPYRERSVPKLVERVLNDDESSVVESAITALGHLGDPRGLSAVVGAANHPTDTIRLSVAMALPKMLGEDSVKPDAPGVAALISLMRDEDFVVRDWATFGLGTQTAADSPEVRAGLADRLADADEVVRREALLGLARRRDDRAVSAALLVLRDENADVDSVAGAIGAAAYVHSARLLPGLRGRVGPSLVDSSALARALRHCDPEERAAEIAVLAELMSEIEEVAPWAHLEISSSILQRDDGGVQIGYQSGSQAMNYDLEALWERAGSVDAMVDILLADGALRPPRVDPEVWVENSSGLRHYLIGNAHTHLGRMLAWVDDVGYTRLSKNEIVSSSARASDWVAGFMAGSEPELEVFLGRMVPLPGEPTPEDEARWLRALDHYRESGTLRTLGYVPTLPLPDGVVPGWAWTVVGHQVYRWDGQAWRVTDELVDPWGAVVARSLCDERGHCSMAALGEDHIVCEDCGSATEVEPD